jgi:hypothetical protein
MSFKKWHYPILQPMISPKSDAHLSGLFICCATDRKTKTGGSRKRETAGSAILQNWTD